MRYPKPLAWILSPIIFFLMVGVLSTMILIATPALAETAVAPEKNPPGDIPDTQVFIVYSSSAGYSLKVPEGWARTENGSNVRFVSKLDGVEVTVTPAVSAPTLDWVKTRYILDLEKTGRAIKIEKLSTVSLPSGPVIRIDFSSNSDPNPVTNKQIRLEHNRYLFFKNGKLAALDLYAPYGADNVDQWQLMSRSFRWH